MTRRVGSIIDVLCRTHAMADEVFGDRRKAHAWLHRPNGALSGQVPFSLLDTEAGRQQVEAILGRIAHGVVE